LKALASDVQKNLERPLDEIRAKGIILDSNAYLGFEFTLGLSLDSKATQFTFPVVFDKRGVAVPQPTLPPSDPERASMPPLTTIVPMLLKPSSDLPEPTVTLPSGEVAEVRIPSVLVIPGNVGYLKQFFSAKLFVANGAPGSSNLTVHDVIGTITMPAGADQIPNTADDPLTLPDTTKGPQSASMPGMRFFTAPSMTEVPVGTLTVWVSPLCEI